MIRSMRLLLATAIFISPLALRAQTSASPKAQGLQKRLDEIAASFPGKVGVYVKNVETGAEAAINADNEYPMASTYKVPIMVQVFRDADAGKFSLTDRVTLKESDRRAGSGLLTHMTPGLSPTIHDLMLLMITVSDNEATDALLNRVGAANVTATMKQLGIEGLRVDRTTEQIIADYLMAGDPSIHSATAAEIYAHPEVFEKLTPAQMNKAAQTLTDDPKDHTSPRAMGQLLEKVVKNQAASEKSCKGVLAIMQQQQHTQRISRFLEEGTAATKSGTIGATTNDVGVIQVGGQHVVIAVYTIKADSLVRTTQAEEVIGRIAKASYDYFDEGNSGK